MPRVGEVVTFNGSSSTPDGGAIVSYAWSFGDGGTGSGEIATHVYSVIGNFTVNLNVTDSEGLWDLREQQIEVIPLPLSVSINPLSASVLLGQSVTFTSTVNGGWSPYKYQWYVGDSPILGATSNGWEFIPSTVGFYHVCLKVTDTSNNTAQSETARVGVTSTPVGGYSVSLDKHTIGKPLTPDFALVIRLALLLAAFKRKTKRRD